jgi:hypothetical protein
MVRPAISYGAAVWHSSNRTFPKGPAAKLAKHQNSGLRQVIGAFKATPIRQLESVAYAPPLGLRLNRRIVRFQARLKRTDMARADQRCLQFERSSVPKGDASSSGRQLTPQRLQATVSGKTDRAGNRAVERARAAEGVRGLGSQADEGTIRNARL